ncbi:MAG: hypothetical protein WC521_07105 [Bdellovibrionales bacterium]
MGEEKTQMEQEQQATNDATNGLLPDPMGSSQYQAVYNRVQEQLGLDDARNGVFPRSNASLGYLNAYNEYKNQNMPKQETN